MKKILIIDNEKDIRSSVKSALDIEGYQVVEAANGKTGLSKLKKEKFDLIILDIMMPKMSGFSVLKKIRQTDKKIKIIFKMMMAQSTIIDLKMVNFATTIK